MNSHSVSSTPLQPPRHASSLQPEAEFTVPFKVDIDPERLQEALIASLLNTSDFGLNLKKMIEKAVKENWGRTAEDVINRVFKDVMETTVRVTIQREYTEKIEEAVRNYINPEWVNKAAEEAADAALDRIAKR